MGTYLSIIISIGRTPSFDMTFMKYVFGILLLFVCTLGMSGAERAAGDTEIGFNEAVSALVEGLDAATQVEIHEGLPHLGWERQLFEQERKSTECQEIAGQWVYAKPQMMKAVDTAELKRLVAGGLLLPWRGAKRCGGFHADYVVTITSAKKTLHVLFCFGCHEVKIVREVQAAGNASVSTEFRLTTDVDAEQFKQWTERLDVYRKLRPGSAGPTTRK